MKMETHFRKLILIFTFFAFVWTEDARSKKPKNIKKNLDIGQPISLKPKNSKLEKMYSRLVKYYKSGLSLEDARKRHRVIDRVVLDMEKRNRTESIGPGKY